jgi:small-conductance mechanosensitive channel
VFDFGGLTSTDVTALQLGLAALVVVVLLVVMRLALKGLRHALERTSADLNARAVVLRLAQFAFIGLGGYWVLTILGVEVSALTAVIGLAGLAISLAVQDLLRNLVAGLYLLIERPFGIGEHVDFRTFSGIVEATGMRTTVLRMTDGSKVVIPNALLLAEPLLNRTSHVRRAVRLRVAIPIAGPSDTPAPDARVEEAKPAAPPSPQRLREELLGAVVTAGGIAEGTAPVAIVESVTSQKITLRLEASAGDAREIATRLAWVLHERLPDAEITVLD